jgi:prepilin-type N-terminal cleavage/methylation domain-containing protein
MALNTFPLNRRGVTLLEILIASLLLSLVIGVAASLYVSGARFLGTVTQSARDFQATNLNPITKRIDISNSATVQAAGKQLDLTCDCDFTTLQPQGALPYNPADDNSVRFFIQNPGVRMQLGGGPLTTLYTNVDTNASMFRLINPSGEGQPTVVEVEIVFTTPRMTLKTQTALGSGAKRP